MNILQRLFSQPRVKVVSEPAVPDNDTAPEEIRSAGNIASLPPGLHVGRLSDIGQVRERNEDSFYTFEGLMGHNEGLEPFGLFVVADGMGGHQKGEVASSLAIRSAAHHLLREVYLPFLRQSSPNASSPSVNEILAAAVDHANNVVQEETPEGGTTLTAALLMGNSAYIAHVGDSRAYLIGQDSIKQITKDHSYVQRLVEIGQETPEGALIHPQRNVLYRALGQGGTLEVDTYVQYIPPGSSLLLCSDGLWGLIDDEMIQNLVSSSTTPQEACECLVSTANKNGGEDNITAVIVTMGISNQVD